MGMVLCGAHTSWFTVVLLALWTAGVHIGVIVGQVDDFACSNILYGAATCIAVDGLE